MCVFVRVCVCVQYVKPMNFQEEVRAHRDLDNFLAQASIMLDERATTLDEVLRRMLAHMLEEGRESCDLDEVMNSVFTDAGGKDFDGEQRAREVLFRTRLDVDGSEIFLPPTQFTCCLKPFRV